MANYLDGMEGGKHNSDNCEATPSKMKIKRVVFEIEVEVDAGQRENIEAAKTVQEWLQEDDCQNWQFYVQDVEDGTIVSIDLDEDESCMELPADNYTPLIETK